MKISGAESLCSAANIFVGIESRWWFDRTGKNDALGLLLV